MLKVKFSVKEVVANCKEIAGKPKGLLRYIREDVQLGLSRFFEELMESELTLVLGRERYVRGEGRSDNRRNGYRERSYTLLGLGEIRVRIPRDRKGEYRPKVFPPYQRYDRGIGENATLMFLLGMSTRNISVISRRLFGRSLSPSEISENNKELIEGIERWRSRDLSSEDIKYLFIDGVNFPLRVGRRVEKVPTLVVISVDRSGLRKVIALQSGDKESAPVWRELFRDLKMRGLNGSKVELGIMDGLSGLERVFYEEFPRAKIQRCQVHVARNVLAKVPRSLKQDVADGMRSVFYAPSYEQAISLWKEFHNRFVSHIPSAVACLKKNLEACLTYLQFKEAEWISLRTTNCIERLHKEFKRRTKPMEILPGESSLYLILGVISIKMEGTWRSSPFGGDNLGLSDLYLERAHFN